jgi:hypothetical protein
MGLVGSTACLVDLSSNVPLQHVKKKKSVFTPLCNSPLCARTLYPLRFFLSDQIHMLDSFFQARPTKTLGMLVEMHLAHGSRRLEWA